MYQNQSDKKISKKWTTYITGIMTKNFVSFKKSDKYFRMNITESTAKAIEENWIRKLGIDYQIISVNICKNNEPLGIAIEGCNVVNENCRDIIQRHYLKTIMPNFCIGLTKRFMVGDELLEVSGLMIYGMKSKDVVTALKKLACNIQVVVARSIHPNDGDISDNDESDGANMPISFYNMDEDMSSKTSTLKSNSSVFSTTSRDFGSGVSLGGLIDSHHERVVDYLRDIIGWRGPIVIGFKKQHKESLGLALEEILDPLTSEVIIVFKIIIPNMKVGKDGRIHVGDRLLQVNGKAVLGIPFKKICQWMKSAPGGRLVLYICKPHFKPVKFDKYEGLLDQSAFNTLAASNKLSQLKEETDKEFIEIPPVPESHENHVTIKKENDKLGLFLDIVDNGKNGCRIKKMVNGLAKSNGLLHEGDYITEINGVSLKTDSKNTLEYCLKNISKCNSDYEISYFTKEDVDIHSFSYTTSVKDDIAHSQKTYSTNNLYPDPSLLTSNNNDPHIFGNSYDTGLNEKASFETFLISINNDGVTNLGLVLLPSLSEPNRYVGIADIHAGSLADNCKLLKINDIIFSVNDKSFEWFSPTDAGVYLKNLIQSEERLIFKIKRLINDDDFEHENRSVMEVENKCLILSYLPDMCYCDLKRTCVGYGLSLKKLKSNFGVIVNDIEPEGVSYKAGNVKSGYRLVMINNEPVIAYSVDAAIKMVKNSQHSISLIMERPKFQELNVQIIKDDNNSIGLNIGGGIDTKYSLPIIEGFIPKTTCKFSEYLQIDDLIKEVNEISMINRDHEDIIKILRALPNQSSFKIWRKLPFLKRDMLNSLNNTTFLSDYLKFSQFSVTINKPVNNIPSFGINFGDVLILDHDGVGIICRYKIISSIEKDSLVEKYAPDISAFSYLVAINGNVIDVTMTCEDLKTMIDNESQITLTLSRDIPYSFNVSTCDKDRIVEEFEEHPQSFNISDSNSKELFDVSEEQTKEICLQTSCQEGTHNADPTVTLSDSHVDDNVLEAKESRINEDEKEHDDVLCLERINQEIEPPIKEISFMVESNVNVAEEDTRDQPLSVDQSKTDLSNNDESEVIIPSMIISSSEIDDYIKDIVNEGYIFQADTPIIQDDSIEVKAETKQPIIEEEMKCLQHDQVINDNSSENENSNEEDNVINTEEAEADQKPENISLLEHGVIMDLGVSEVESKEEIERNDGKSVLLTPDEDNIDVKSEHDECIREIDTLVQNSAIADGDVIKDETNHNDFKNNEEFQDENQHIIEENITKDSASEDFDYMKKIDAESIAEFGIVINSITVPKIENTELGVHVFGGINGGPGGETLPIYVIGVEKNTCNWPGDKEEPFLNNGVQLLELNGCDIAAFDSLTVEKMIATTDGDLSFKVLRFK